MNFSINLIDLTKVNSGVITITERPPYKLTVKTPVPDRNIYNIKGSAALGSRVTVGTAKIEVRDKLVKDFAFFKKPSLKSTRDVKLVQRSVEQFIHIDDHHSKYRGGTYITSYTFDILYKVSNKDVTTNLIYKDGLTPALRRGYAGISNISFDKKLIGPSGGTREIKVHGKPGSKAKFRIVDDNGDSLLQPPKDRYSPTVTRSWEFGVEDKFPFGEMLDETGTPRVCRDIIIPDSGVFSFDVKYPSSTVNVAKVVGDFTPASKIIFNNLYGVKAGDKVIKQSVGSELTTLTVVAVNPDGDNENELTLSQSITLNNGNAVIFKRARTYEVFIKPNDKFLLGPKIPRSQPAFKISQYANPVLTVTLMDTRGGYEITDFNGVDINPNLGAGNPHISTYLGAPGAKEQEVDLYKFNSVKNRIDFKYKLDQVNPSHAFTSLALFNTKDFTVGGDSSIEFSVSGIKHTLSGSPTGHVIEIEFTINIAKWGKTDTSLTLDLTDLLT